MSKTVLIFPPASEATLFPYLSLPMLAGALKRADIPVAQYDLNLEMIRSMLQPASLEGLKRIVTDTTRNTQAKLFRLAVLGYAERYPGLWLEATRKGSSGEGTEAQARSIRIVKRVFDIALEASCLGAAKANLRETLAAWKNPVATGCTPDQDPLFGAMESWVSATLPAHPCLVGITLPFFDQILPAAALAALLKTRNPGSVVVLGGPQVWLHLDLLEGHAGLSEAVDGLCFGPGEGPFTELARHLQEGLEGLPSLPNFRWARKGRPPRPGFQNQVFPDLNALPGPVFETLPQKDYLIDEVQWPLITCLGCYWGRCTFCSYGNRYHFARHYQELTPAHLADHCQRLVQSYGAQRINFVDENTNTRLVVHAMQELEQRGVHIRFSIRTRLEKHFLDLKFCQELRRLGCVLMSVGFETRSQRLLDKLQRGLDAKTFQPVPWTLSCSDPPACPKSGPG